MSAEIKKIMGVGGDLDKKSADFLSTAMLKQAQKDFDYIKFKQSLNQMGKLGLAESTAIQSAYATASTIGVTKATLINSAKHYLSVLMNEKSQFDSALNNQVKQRVASRKDEVLKLEQQIQEYRKKITAIEKKVAEFENRIANSDEEVENAKAKILKTKTDFETAFDQFVEIIKGDISKFQEHL